MKVSTKLYLGTLFQFAVAISLVVVFLYMQQKQDHDSVSINLAGRQRMLSQKMTKEILLFTRGACSVENVLNTVKVFDKTLRALTYGGDVPLDLAQTTFTTLPAPETRAVAAQLKIVESIWRSFSEIARSYLTEKTPSSLAYLKGNNGLLLQEMNRAVFLMDEDAAAKIASMRSVLISGSAVLFLLFLFTLFIVRKNVQIIFEQLQQSYNKVKRLNRAKDCVIHHLSHELKTPTSILDASLGLLQKRLAYIEAEGQDLGCHKILARARKNLTRLLEMQYEVGDLLQKQDYRIHYLMSKLLDLCADELEVLISEEIDEKNIIQLLRRRIDDIFGPRNAVSEEIQLDEFVAGKINELRPKFSHRNCMIKIHISTADRVLLPSDVLSKIIEGLIRNAIENTPAGGQVDVTVRTGAYGPEFEVRDNGVGISEENQRLIFENYFTAYDPIQYSSRKPYDFNAGGKGIDFLRMRIFSERYNFKIQLVSRRCSGILQDTNTCPGNVEDCDNYNHSQGSRDDHGTTVTIQFSPAHQITKKENFNAARFWAI
jgi:signal transduction histidine kinase